MDVDERGKARTFCGGPEGSSKGKVKNIYIVIKLPVNSYTLANQVDDVPPSKQRRKLKITLRNNSFKDGAY